MGSASQLMIVGLCLPALTSATRPLFPGPSFLWSVPRFATTLPCCSFPAFQSFEYPFTAMDLLRRVCAVD